MIASLRRHLLTAGLLAHYIPCLDGVEPFAVVLSGIDVELDAEHLTRLDGELVYLLVHYVEGEFLGILLLRLKNVGDTAPLVTPLRCAASLGKDGDDFSEYFHCFTC